MTLTAPVLMLVTDRSVPDLEARLAAAIAGGAAWVQYRDKRASTAERAAWARAFKERHPGTVLMVNNDAVAAEQGGADGVHWPGSAPAAAGLWFGSPTPPSPPSGRGGVRVSILEGYPCGPSGSPPAGGGAGGGGRTEPQAERSRGRLVHGRSLHPDDLPTPDITGLAYAIFGTVFPSATHPGGPVAGLKGLEAASRLPLPVLAIGGITAKSAGDCIRAGAAGVAVIRAVLMAHDPARAAADILQTMRETKA